MIKVNNIVITKMVQELLDLIHLHTYFVTTNVFPLYVFCRATFFVDDRPSKRFDFFAHFLNWSSVFDLIEMSVTHLPLGYNVTICRSCSGTLRSGCKDTLL